MCNIHDMWTRAPPSHFTQMKNSSCSLHDTFILERYSSPDRGRNGVSLKSAVMYLMLRFLKHTAISYSEGYRSALIGVPRDEGRTMEEITT